MSTSLTERYIAATIKDLPQELHDEVRPELAASIADAVDARLEQGQPREAAEREVLTDLGDPAVLAAGYADRSLQLIGPRFYLTWWRLLKRLLIIVPIVVFTVVVFVEILSGGDFGDVLGGAIPSTITAGMHVCFWVTLVFFILERSDADTGLTWDVDQLPEPREDHRSGTDLAASLIFLGLVLAALVWDQLRGFIRINDEPIPILNPDLWPWAILGLLAIIALEVVFAIVLYIKNWSTTLAVWNTAITVVFFSWTISLLVRGDLFGPEFLNLWTINNVTDDTLYTLAVIFGFGVTIICVWDIVDGWIKTYRTGRLAGRQQEPTTSQ